MFSDSRERVLDWRDEVRRLGPLLDDLPLAARNAVLDVVAAFLSEDAVAALDGEAEHVGAPRYAGAA
jgi:hypothetical protein